MSDETLDRRLESRVKQALVPTRFPERRDVELAFKAGQAADSAVFIDHFWQGVSQLWIVVAQVSRTGLEGALRAAVLRQMIRALTAELGDPAAVTAYVEGDTGADLTALAVLRLDAATGQVVHSSTGLALCAAPATAAAGEVFWLAIGGDGLPQDRVLPAEGLQALVDRYAGGDHPALAAIQFKAKTRRGRSLTLAVRNDRAGIPDALSSARTFLETHDVPEEVVAAFELSLDEILTNQINYGFRDGAAHEILIELRVDGDCVRLEIRDDGVPFDPLSVAAPNLEAGIEERQLGGLGMHFVRTLVDEASYRRDGGWNVLALGKYIDQTAQVQA